ncbi:MAG: ATP-dependent DNA helicase [Candidatus Gracilibacteria bacterium]
MLFQKIYNHLNESQKEAVDHTEGPAMVIAGPGTGKTQVLGARTANLILKAGVNPENILITTFTESGVIAIKERLIKFIGTDAHKVYVSTIHSFAQDVIKTFPTKFDFEKTSVLIDDVDSFEILSEIIEKLVNEKKLEYLFTPYDKLFYLSDIKRAIGNLKQEGVSEEKLQTLIYNEEKYYTELLEEKKSNKRIKNIEKYEKEYATALGKMKELFIVFKEYKTTLREKSYYDFSDMINFVLEKFKCDEDLRYYYAEKFQYIMLDEFQDTNNAQNEIIDLILNPGVGTETPGFGDEPNIVVVGDDDQSIYRFQGANIENMLDFSNKYKKTKFIVLEKNYRSTQPILDTSRSLIKNNFERLVNKINGLKKDLISVKSTISNLVPLNKGESLSDNESRGIPTFYSATNELDEKNYILDKINEANANNQLIDSGSSPEGQIPLNSIAIIVRSNKEVEDWSKFLQDNSIEVESKLKTNILKSDYIIFLLKYLEIIDNPYAKEDSFIDILRCEFVDVDKIDVLSINKYLYNINYTRKEKVRFFDILKNLENLEENPPNTLDRRGTIEFRNKQKLIDFRDNLIYLNSRLSTTNFIIFFNEFIEKTAVLDYIEKNGTFDDLQDIFSLFQKIKKWTEFNKSFSVKNLIRKINLHNKFNILIERQILKTANKGVQIMTAHGSKGLEFDTVFIPGLYDGNWNNKRIIEKLKLPRGIVGEGLQEAEDAKIDKKEKQLEDDRRLFFVALTRAENNLFLSFSRSKEGKINIMSQFIEELGDTINFIEQENSNEALLVDSVKNMLLGNHSNLIKYSDLELKYIEEFLKNYKLSPSDLNKFLEDPSVFLKEAIFKYPFVDNEATIFGKVYHRSLELFFIKSKKDGSLPKSDYLTATFSLLLKQEILTPEELDRLEERGIKGLTGYYETYKNNFREFLDLEYNFRGKNIVFEGIPITGKIDKIEKYDGFIESNTPSSSGQFALFKEHIAIIDFKTGSIKRIGEIKGTDKDGNKKPGFKEGKYGRQLLFYQLLCELDREFSSKYDIVSTGLDFVEGKNDEYKIVNIEFTKEESDEFKELVKETRGKISDINFWKEFLIK